MGNLVQQTDARGQVITMCYDTLNRLTGKAYNASTCASPEISYTYGTSVRELGYRVGMVDLSGSTSWTYNARGQVTAESKTITGMGTFSTQWAYNTAGMLTQLTYPGGAGGQAGETVYYRYNHQGMMDTVTSMQASDGYVSRTDYDASGRIMVRQYNDPEPGMRWQGLMADYSYFPWTEQGGRVQTLRSGSEDGGIITGIAQESNYTYDSNGNVLSINNLVDGDVQAFSYDELDRLTSAAAAGGNGSYPLENYSYDSIGRLDVKADVALSYNATASQCQGSDRSIPHAVSSANSLNYAYDCNGNMITRQTGDGTQTLIYDAEGRVVEIKLNDVTILQNVYDGDGKKVLVRQFGQDGEETTAYIGNYFEYKTTGAANETTQYYFAGTQRVAMRKAEKLNYLVGDHLGSTSYVYNDMGYLEAEQRYKPWGETRYFYSSDFAGLTTLPTDYQFTGQRNIESIGLYDYVARYYDTFTGHFIQADTIVPEKVQGTMAWNRFAYVNYSPINYSDPTGHCIFGIDTIFCVMAAAAVVGAAVGYVSQVINNYQNGYEGKDAWTKNISAEPIVGGAIIGAGAPLMVPAALAMGSEFVMASGAATNSTSIFSAGQQMAAANQSVMNFYSGPANLAHDWQVQSMDYGNADDWQTIRLPKGTTIYGGEPGQGNFYTNQTAFDQSGFDASKLYSGLQTGHPGFPTFRAGVTEYVLTKDTYVGSSFAFANPQYGAGGSQQYFIKNYQQVLKPVVTWLMNNLK